MYATAPPPLTLLQQKMVSPDVLRCCLIHRHARIFFTYSPIKADSNFLQLILLKLARNLKNGKNRIPPFLFFFNMTNNKDIRD
jgi:hypothetical protein